jgi:hypothetical protein
MHRGARPMPKGPRALSSVALHDTSVIWPEVSFERLATGLLFVAIALSSCLMPAQSDTWWQLRTGEQIWANHAVDLHDRFSYTVHGAYWPNHEWLSQVAFFAAYHIGGMSLLTALCAGAVLGAWILVWRLGPKQSMWMVVWCAAALISSSPGWSLRPQVFTLLLVAVTVTMLEHRRYRWLPLVFLVWANLHGGVMLGFVLLGAAILAAAIADDGPVVQARRVPVALIVSALACVLATALTPLGTSLWREVPASLARLRDYRVLEWRPPSLAEPALIPFWIVAASLAAWAARSMWRRAPLVVWSAFAMLPLSLASGRNVPPFLLLAVPAVATLQRGRASSSHRVRRHVGHLKVNAAMLGGAAVVAALVVASAWTRPWARLGWHPIPKGAIAVIDRCPGRLYNRYDEGGYLIWFARQQPVFLDSRQDPYPLALVREQMAVEKSGDYRDLFARYKVHCAFVPAGTALAQRLRADGWRALYAGSTWAVLATPEPYHDAGSVQP